MDMRSITIDLKYDNFWSDQLYLKHFYWRFDYYLRWTINENNSQSIWPYRLPANEKKQTLDKSNQSLIIFTSLKIIYCNIENDTFE